MRLRSRCIENSGVEVLCTDREQLDLRGIRREHVIGEP